MGELFDEVIGTGYFLVQIYLSLFLSYIQDFRNNQQILQFDKNYFDEIQHPIESDSTKTLQLIQ